MFACIIVVVCKGSALVFEPQCGSYIGLTSKEDLQKQAGAYITTKTKHETAERGYRKVRSDPVPEHTRCCSQLACT